MSVYFRKGKGWRFDFMIEGIRHTQTWFKTKQEAKTAENQRREEVKQGSQKKTRLDFVLLLEKRLEYIKAYHSIYHFKMNLIASKKWSKRWGLIKCDEFNMEMIQSYLIDRKKETSAYTANMDLRYLRATFNFGIKQNLIEDNPTKNISFFPVQKKNKYIPSKEDIAKVLLNTNYETREYLIAISETFARVGEINNLKWSDVDFKNKKITLYTRKKKGGSLSPGDVPMTQRLYDILFNKFEHKQHDIYVFVNPKTKQPYIYRKKLLKGLCKRTGVKNFTFHALRHYGASVLDNANVPIRTIQKLLRHENRSTTEKYIQEIGDSEREAMRIFEEKNKVSHTISHTKKGGYSYAY